jgi:ubiquinone/menaquinone biosynthesis C-methylase UbiE
VFRRGGPTFLELTRQALSSTERGYDLIAPKFELTPFRTPDPIVREIAHRIGAVESALDVCCGTGAALGALCAQRIDRIVGIDMSAGMLEIARKRVGSDPRVELVRGDALDMPFTGEFDAAVSVGAFGHIEVKDEPRFLASIHRALRPGGRFVFATSTMPPWWSASRVIAETFNAVMRVRNAVLEPPFVMYYLTFLWPEVRGRLLAAGFSDVECVRGAFAKPYERALLVVARKS